jgi:hemerythrin superfamily protein
MGEKRDMIDVLVHDHREVEEMFTALETGSTEPKQRRELTDKVIVELVRHSVAEELYLYPTTREVLPGGDAIADREIQEHAAAERVMKELDGMDPADPAYEGLLAQLVTDIRGHIAEEESDLFPRLRTACSEEDLVELGEKIERVKKVAPTRPHPDAPDTPPANRLGAPVLGLVDRVRDALSGRARG